MLIDEILEYRSSLVRAIVSITGACKRPSFLEFDIDTVLDDYVVAG